MLNVVIRAVDYRCKERFSIEEHNSKYSLLFYEWSFSEKPWDEVDPIIVDATLEECLERLFEVLQRSNNYDAAHDDDNSVVKMPPKQRYKVRVEVRSIEKGKPKPIIDPFLEKLLLDGSEKMYKDPDRLLPGYVTILSGQALSNYKNIVTQYVANYISDDIPVLYITLERTPKQVEEEIRPYTERFWDDPSPLVVRSVYHTDILRVSDYVEDFKKQHPNGELVVIERVKAITFYEDEFESLRNIAKKYNVAVLGIYQLPRT